MRIGINGMGRIGRLALRAAMGAAERPADDPRAGNRLEVVHLNELKGGIGAIAHLLAFDSVQGRWRADIAAESDSVIRIGDRKLAFTAHATSAEIPWGDLGVDLVLECTGKFLTPETLQGHFDRGAKRVIVAAPVKIAHEPNSVLNIVIGVNHHRYDPAQHRIVTAASCTTNCLAPVVKVIHEGIGIRHGMITTIHDMTNTQSILDTPHKDLRRARASSLSLIPKRMTICFAVAVTFSRSLEAPVVISEKMISSAARPPSVIAIESCSSARVVRNLSSTGIEIVYPSAWPRETTEILWTGSECSR